MQFVCLYRVWLSRCMSSKCLTARVFFGSIRSCTFCSVATSLTLACVANARSRRGALRQSLLARCLLSAARSVRSFTHPLLCRSASLQLRSHFRCSRGGFFQHIALTLTPLKRNRLCRHCRRSTQSRSAA